MPTGTVQAYSIGGVVHDPTGKPLGYVVVRLVRSGDSAPIETTTLNDGTFHFSNLSPGSYSLTAGHLGSLTHAAAVTLSNVADQPSIELVLDEPAPGKSRSTSPPVMEFSDAPNFTVAAVTDWTAAGGHGSDANLRTSEALNRATANLKPAVPAASTSPLSPQPAPDESALRNAVSRLPGDFDANHNLGEFYLHAGRAADSITPFEAAYKINPASSQNAFDLATALCETGDVKQAREHVNGLLARSENADLHRLAGEIDEKSGDPLRAVHEFELAVHQEPSEQNYFAWGSELLLHRAVLQAKDVFAAGARAYPQSARMLTALGAALFAGALYDQAAHSLCGASDLDQSAPEPYLFMGKIELAAPSPLPCIEQKLERFVQSNPEDPQANYYYAMTIWKQSGQSPDSPTLARIESLLTKAVTLNPHFSDAYLQMGILKSTERDYQSAILFYSKAIDANPDSTQAHYRLAMAFDRVGEKDKAKQQAQIHDDLEKQQAAEVDRQRREVKQFLVVVDNKAAGSQAK